MENEYLSPEEFLCDESFIDWLNRSDPKKTGRWEQWIKKNPGKQHLVDEAVELYHTLFVTESLKPEQLLSAEEKIFETIEPSVPRGKVFNIQRWMIAAAIAAVFAAAVLMFYHENKQEKIKSQFGEVVKNILPDGSEVMLNANSSVRYNSGWDSTMEREVWIEGEAFFHVAKTAKHNRFVVHTDRFDVVVTGTQFSVVNKAEVSNVVLKEGSVTVQAKNGKVVYMRPGDFIELRDDALTQKKVTAEQALAWMEDKLYFDKTPLAEVVKIISEHYGVAVELADTGLSAETISGVIPNNNLDTVLKALGAVSDLSIERKENHVLLTRNNH
ncbi:FecR domain-containing protein [Danxiaibacter flavus]|uniref:FecR domain-containing protein n=1 Tax=Danxiaibacter flavus TaxID=3049108 RepID=A0ABV3ZAT1_9BACT|nr:FecR domain-containing protein [Chitinophagaceae bacterium DXS]